ncbi:uncharacterized protein MONBRDRAFT_36929 [Monosiga brevicollis MX1]|uniref:EGF-like domain-containing protein n=1 Tax=Monosiga brevicollis TaxID=81824 RepID=A9UYF9_MONBE|nr:uncharacterized protein MONBRDRAFT_36929 [Monosiga brevicollis MX1]EDQ89599.1 predicted protein [Monosiga brevicollis MX1]|eukprot:XP_001745628.1 hypothetical protein [Monosiga brevicollis MX1]
MGCRHVAGCFLLLALTAGLTSGMESPCPDDTSVLDVYNRWSQSSYAVNGPQGRVNVMLQLNRNGKGVVFGGLMEPSDYFTDATSPKDAWHIDFSNNRWTPIAILEDLIRYSYATAFADHEENDLLFFFGCANGTSPVCFNDTLIYDAADHIIAPYQTDAENSEIPVSRSDSAVQLIYDSEPLNRSCHLVFGGASLVSAMKDTWLFSNGAWTSVSCTTDCPPARAGAYLMSDRKHPGQVIMTSGTDWETTYYDDVWRFDLNLSAPYCSDGQWTRIGNATAIGYSASDLPQYTTGPFQNKMAFWKYGVTPLGSRSLQYLSIPDEAWQKNSTNVTGMLWREIPVKDLSDKPNPRQWSTIAYNPATMSIILWSGYTGVVTENDLWQFDISVGYWRQLNYNYNGLESSIEVASASYFPDGYLFGGANVFGTLSHKVTARASHLAVTLPTSKPANTTFCPDLDIFDEIGMLFVYGGFSTRLTVAWDFWSEFVTDSFGYYYSSANPEVGCWREEVTTGAMPTVFATGACKSHTCIACPNGTTTADVGASALANCSVCVTNDCRHGSCLVNSDMKTVCHCTSGYYGDRCTISIAWVSAAIAIGVVVFASSCCGLVICVRRYHVENRRQYSLLEETKEEVVRLKKIWEIPFGELEFERRIDNESKGAFGEVWLCQWQDRSTAVKRLQRHAFEYDEQAVQDFDKEMTVLRELRHRNITEGTLLWSAPEVLEGNRVTMAADVYSGGVIGLELLTRREPVDHLAKASPWATRDAILAGDVMRFELTPGSETDSFGSRFAADMWTHPEEAQDFVALCRSCMAAADERPTYESVAQVLVKLATLAN